MKPLRTLVILALVGTCAVGLVGFLLMRGSFSGSSTSSVIVPENHAAIQTADVLHEPPEVMPLDLTAGGGVNPEASTGARTLMHTSVPADRSGGPDPAGSPDPSPWRWTRLPNHREALADPELNPDGRDFAISEKRDLAEHIKRLNRPISHDVIERSALMQKVFAEKRLRGEFHASPPDDPNVLSQPVRLADGTGTFLVIWPGENADIDRLTGRINQAIVQARHGIRDHISTLNPK